MAKVKKKMCACLAYLTAFIAICNSQQHQLQIQRNNFNQSSTNSFIQNSKPYRAKGQPRKQDEEESILSHLLRQSANGWRKILASGFSYRSSKSLEPLNEVDPPSDRIFRGWELSPHEFPWMAKLKAVFPPNKNGMFQTRVCGGALLNRRWVVTARHCVTWSPPERPGHKMVYYRGVPARHMFVWLGSHGHFGEDGYMIKALRAIGRSDYGQPQCPSKGGLCNFLNMPWLSKSRLSPMMDNVFTNDIALVQLSAPVEFTNHISPVKLPNRHLSYYGHTGYVSGWGMKDATEKASVSLKAAELKVVNGNFVKGCRRQNGWGKLCAISSGTTPGAGSACPGDSGSPLVTWDEGNGGWTLIGLLSNGAKSCFSEKPEVYTRISDYRYWIIKTMRKYDYITTQSFFISDQLP